MRLGYPLVLLALGGRATYYAARLDQLYGVPDPARYYNRFENR